jgi:hypothetical protein
VNSLDFVDDIKRLYNIDFNSVANVRKLLSIHNLIALVIVDEDGGYVRVFEEGDTAFDTLPIAEIKRQSANDTAIRDVMRVLAAK